MSKMCERCGCGCSGICHTLYTCNGLWTCSVCGETFSTCAMRSLKYLRCKWCVETHARTIQWRPPQDKFDIWALVDDNIISELLFLNQLKLQDAPEASALYARCVTIVKKRVSGFETKHNKYTYTMLYMYNLFQRKMMGKTTKADCHRPRPKI